MAIASRQNGVYSVDIASGTTQGVAFGSSVTSGSLIVGCSTIAADIAVSSFSDGTNNGVQAAAKLYSAGAGSAYEIWCIPNHPGGAVTFTFTWASAGIYRFVGISEWSGAKLSAVAEGQAAAGGNSTTASSGNLSPTPTVNGELIVAHGRTNDDPPTFGSGFAYVPGVTRDGNTFEFLGYLIQSAAAAVAANWTQTSGLWVAQAASFLPAGTLNGDEEAWIARATPNAPIKVSVW